MRTPDTGVRRMNFQSSVILHKVRILEIEVKQDSGHLVEPEYSRNILCDNRRISLNTVNFKTNIKSNCYRRTW